MSQEPLVSIIMPSYNSGKFIEESIASVIKQKYSKWELIIVDDYSTDNTTKIIDEYTSKDTRIKVIKLSQNLGAANARNKGVEIATGKYISFLDSDDTWYEKKLINQIKFMEDNNYHFTCTFYEKIDEKGKKINSVIKMSTNTDYLGLLKNCPGNSSVIYNSEKLGKVKIPLIKKRNDYLMWLQVVKNEDLKCLQEVLSTHRVHEHGISSKKKSLVKYHWEVYRRHEGLPVLKSSYLILYWIYKSIKAVFLKKVT